MARRKRRYGSIVRSKSKVERGGWAARRAGHMPASREHSFPLRVKVHRMNEPKGQKFYEAWICLPSRTGRIMNTEMSMKRRSFVGVRGCGLGAGNTPTAAIKAAAHDFARTLKGR